MMTIEEGMGTIEYCCDQRRLNKIQKIIFQESWKGHSYIEIANNFSYDLGYVTDAGSKLWQLLSEALGEKVTKKNFQLVLEQHWRTMYARKTQLLQESVTETTSSVRLNGSKHQSWGEAIDVSFFCGRTVELAKLTQWSIHERCRLILLLGMGGIGKTTLTVRCAKQIQEDFEYVVWKSLRNAPSVLSLLTEIILFLSDGLQEVEPLETTDQQISCLIKLLRSKRCLLILDNAESILQSGQRGGHYRNDYEGYGQLLRRVGDECHQSCIILTSREKPVGLTAREGKALPVRSLQLTGLSHSEAQKILEVKGITSTEFESGQLVQCYAGNPLALKISATTIESLYDGNVSKFLQQGTIVFGDIWELLDQQFNRLSDLEKQVMYRMAANPNCITLQELQESILPKVSNRELIEALESLQQRSLIERQQTLFIQHPIIREYIAESPLSYKMSKLGSQTA
ncbi:MAG: NACHT domain-containing protein [Chroococcidiopsidaceae cyanobacterium CP_BM_RX_35]|nr:NACHT domain-containing protein [Chroococcidiopsidaceae cyanobacterium CP_BM_RX_35]